MSGTRIKVLGDHVCNKIAAGEVIERPASVFKELIENSIDAGADAIEVEVLQGGRKAVVVTDNGSGMGRDDALLCIERHATSKIRDVDDIEHILTMGFRGEALAAIAAVSHFHLTTRRPEDLGGTEVIVEGGVLRDVRETGCPPGTTLAVRNLFHNVPARRKFLRAESTELAAIRALFQVFALAHPNIALRLSVDGRELERLPKHDGLADRIAELYGDAFLAQLRPVDFLRGDLHIHGFAGLPTLHRGDRKDQVTLVNRRPATAPIVGYALREAYRDALPRDRNPVVFLHLDVPPDWVDVNVHPTKREVRFGPSQLIRDALIEALAETLRGPVPARGPELAQPVEPPPAPPPRLDPAHRQMPLPPPSYPPLPPRGQPAAPLPPPPRPPEPSTPPVVGGGPWKHAEVLGQVGQRFALLETEDGMVIMDPQAAWERVLYEQARAEMDARQTVSQGLLAPETVECDAGEADRIRQHLDDFRALGFVLEPFGGDSFLVEATPAWMGDTSPARLLKDLAQSVESGVGKPLPAKEVRDALARSCCRLAAERRGRFRDEELRKLVDRLARCRMPYTTPFGRPTLIFMGFRELQRKFGIENA